MSHTFRNSRMATTAKFAGAVLIPGLISVGTAAADDTLSVTNKSEMAVMVLILDIGKNELGRKLIEKNTTKPVSSAKSGVSITKSAAYVEAFR